MINSITTVEELTYHLDKVPICQQLALKGRGLPKWFCIKHRCFWYERYVDYQTEWDIVGPQNKATYCGGQLIFHREWVHLDDDATEDGRVITMKRGDITTEDIRNLAEKSKILA